nr:glucoside xylosyltransferase 1-like isoform X1 [Ciona intestinalis]|eukprot:XP_018671616.2 glucoside xylosyltransferase 1-like isoform X1 [Ciona intestinalis]
MFPRCCRMGCLSFECKRCRLFRINIILLWIGVVSVACVTVNWIILQTGSRSTSPPEVMHLAAVSCGRPNYQGIRDIKKPMDQTLTMIKSASLFAHNPLHIHIFTENDMISMFQTEIDAWPARVRSRVTYSIRPIDYERYLPPTLITQWKKWYKPCGSFRLLLPMVLKDVTDAAIYSDSDVIFIKPIDELWAQLKEMDERQVAAISPTAGHPLGGSKLNENFISHSTGLFQINTGVMVLNFTRMLSSDWLLFHDEHKTDQSELRRVKYGIDLLLPYYDEYKEKAEHDQKLLNIMFHFNPSLLRQLPCSWNFKNNFCQDEDNTCSVAERGGAGAVHGITSAFFNDVNPTFRALYESFLQYDFEPNLDKYLLQPYLQQLAETAEGTFCLTKSHVITTSLKSSVGRLMAQEN